MSEEPRTLSSRNRETRTGDSKTIFFEVTERIPEFDLDGDHEFTQQWTFRIDSKSDVAMLEYFEQDGESYHHHSIDDIPADVVERVEQEGYELEEQ